MPRKWAPRQLWARTLPESQDAANVSVDHERVPQSSVEALQCVASGVRRAAVGSRNVERKAQRSVARDPRCVQTHANHTGSHQPPSNNQHWCDRSSQCESLTLPARRHNRPRGSRQIDSGEGHLQCPGGSTGRSSSLTGAGYRLSDSKASSNVTSQSN